LGGVEAGVEADFDGELGGEGGGDGVDEGGELEVGLLARFLEDEGFLPSRSSPHQSCTRVQLMSVSSFQSSGLEDTAMSSRSSRGSGAVRMSLLFASS
jgi:hypothetical protein